ncbi:glycosyltransferase family 1 protein [bacterium]|nr:MAG: glycosyltransferase family 1 protein [bacterium]
MRVAMVSAGFPPSLGGAERQAYELSRALRARGHDVFVLTRALPGLPAREDVDGVPVERLAAWGGGVLNSSVFFAACLKRLLRGDYDAVHAHLASSPALAAALAGRLLGKPAVVKLGGGKGIGEIALSAKSAAGRLKLALFKLLRPRFIAVAAELSDELAEHGLGTAEVVPNGVDLKRFRPPASGEKESLRAALGLGPGPVFLYMGRLAWEKRLPAFARAFGRACAGTVPPPQFVCVGAGPERVALEALGPRVLEPVCDPAPLYRAADVFVLPSVSEGLSNALLEALASGLPVLGSRVGGTAEAVEDGRSGLLFDGDPDPGAAAPLRRLLDDPGLRARLAAGARERAKAFGMESVAARVEALYRVC